MAVGVGFIELDEGDGEVILLIANKTLPVTTRIPNERSPIWSGLSSLVAFGGSI